MLLESPLSRRGHVVNPFSLRQTEISHGIRARDAVLDGDPH